MGSLVHGLMGSWAKRQVSPQHINKCSRTASNDATRNRLRNNSATDKCNRKADCNNTITATNKTHKIETLSDTVYGSPPPMAAYHIVLDEDDNDAAALQKACDPKHHVYTHSCCHKKTHAC